MVKGDIKFYDTKKTKKVTPIATITDAYSAYAIYPQSKPLIDQSTLVKVEGRIKIHSKPESETEGFVFVLPEVHPAVSGFEMMLRWLFPVYDTFGLYGRPTRLIADTLDNRGLMFAMPKERRYGYLDIQDVASLVCKEGSQSWSEQEWRKQMKDTTSKRLSSTASRATSRQGSRKGIRTSLPPENNLRFEDGASIRSNPSQRHKHNRSTDTVFATPQKTPTAPSIGSLTSANYHARSASDTLAFSKSPRKRQEQYVPSRLSVDQDRVDLEQPPPPPPHGTLNRKDRPEPIEASKPLMSLDNEQQPPVIQEPDGVGSDLRPQPPPTPVAAPPAFLHSPGERPSMRPQASPELRRANSRMSISTLSQLVDASKSGATSSDAVAAAGAAVAWKNNELARSQDQLSKGVNDTTINRRGSPADQRLPRKGLVAGMNSDNIAANSPNLQAQNQPTRRFDEFNVSSTEKSIARKPVHADAAMTSAADTNKEKEPAEGYPRTTIVHNPFSSPEDDELAKAQDIRDHDSSHYNNIPLDHDSAQKSPESKKSKVSIPKKRPGILKNVGSDKHANTAPANLQTDVLTGQAKPTQSSSPGIRHSPGSQGAPKVSPRWDQSRTPSDSLTPKEERRLSYLGRVSPNSGPNSRSHSHSPNPQDRAVPWQPGSATVGSGRKSPGPRLTPEEFVQQRASSSRAVTPVYAHQKNRSTGHLPQEHSSSVDPVRRKEMGSRPASGDVSTILAQQHSYSSHLSAREQEHVARMTNSPLLNLNARKTQGPPAAGLVGAIEAREQEKKQIRQGISGQMVQHAIAQRQQQAQQQYQAYQQQLAYQQAQQAQAISPSEQAYQAQVAAGFFGQPQPQSRSTPNSPGGWGMQVSPQQWSTGQTQTPQWPHGQTQTYWGGMSQQQQQQQPPPQQYGGQYSGPGMQGFPRKPTHGEE